ncbi:hypothetical protein D9M73_276770 [compost metagenome]
MDVFALLLSEIVPDHVLLNLLPQTSSSYAQIYIHLQQYLVADRSESNAASNYQLNRHGPFLLRPHEVMASCLDHGNVGMLYANDDASHLLQCQPFRYSELL